MSALPINAAAPSPTGPAQGIGAGASGSQAPGPMVGFEALLAAFFGAQGDLAVAGQAASTTTKPGGALGALVADSLDGSAGAVGPASSDDPNAPAADAAAAAAQAACNAALVLPVVGQPIAAPPATADAAGTAEGATQAVASGKSFTPTFTPVAKGEQIDTDDAAADAAAVAPDPNAALGGKTTKLDPSVATPLNAPQTTALAAPPQIPAAAPPPPPAVVATSETPVAAPVPTATAQALAAPQAAAEAKPTGPATPAPKDKGQPSKAGAAHARIDIAAPGQAKPTSAAIAATDAAITAGEDDGVNAIAARAAGADAKAEAPETPTGSADAGAATASTTNATTLVHPAAIPVRGAPQTVANLAAQIAKKLDGRSTRFDVQLDPAGLGRVDVRMEIGASGRMTAAMTFDTPQAAAELRARAAELQRHLEQAGFDMSGGLSFDVAGDRGQGRQAQQNQDNDSGQAFRGRAFQQALATAGQADQTAASGALNLRRSLLSGVDIRI
jgi:hypothetical protein